MDDRKAKLSCELVPHNDEQTECKIQISGSTNALLNAYSQITTHLLQSLIEHNGKAVAMGMYASVQMDALKNAGIDPEAESKKAEKMLKKLEMLEAFKDIIGKTFEMPDKEGEA